MQGKREGNGSKDRGGDKDYRDKDGGGGGFRRRGGGMQRRKVCRFCADKTLVIDYKDMQLLKYFITDRGKIVPRRISGNCAKHQRGVALGVKRARNIALMPFAVTGR